MVTYGLLFYPFVAFFQLLLAAAILRYAHARGWTLAGVAAVLLGNAAQAIDLLVRAVGVGGRVGARVEGLGAFSDLVIAVGLFVIVFSISGKRARWVVPSAGAFLLIGALRVALLWWVGVDSDVTKALELFSRLAAFALAAVGIVFHLIPAWLRGGRSPEFEQTWLVLAGIGAGLAYFGTVQFVETDWSGLTLDLAHRATAAVVAVAMATAVARLSLGGGGHAEARAALAGTLLGAFMLAALHGGYFSIRAHGVVRPLAEAIPQVARPLAIAVAILAYDLFAVDARVRSLLARATIVFGSVAALVIMAVIIDATGLSAEPRTLGLLVALGIGVAVLPWVVRPLSLLLDPVTTSDARAAAVGDQVGPYRVRAVVAEGGQGRALMGERADGARVLLKEVRLSYRPGERAQRWVLEEEARILGAVQGLHLPHLFGRFDHRGHSYLAREFVEGVPLSDVAVPVSASDAARITTHVLDALALVHKAGAVHGDVKPANVIARGDGSCVLIDLGAAGAFRPGDGDPTRAPFTPDWAPEALVASGIPTVMTDIQQAGLLLSWLLTGVRPARGRILGVAPEGADAATLWQAAGRAARGEYRGVEPFRRDVAAIVWARPSPIRVRGDSAGDMTTR